MLNQNQVALGNKLAELNLNVGAVLRIAERMKGFNIDAAGGPQPFSVRLQVEQKWSVEFTKLAIREYQRFMILAASMSSEATPSKSVDLVWHKHLTYTRSYWNELCAKVLEKNIHHNPGNGANDETRYQPQYARTLEAYEAIFQEKPPPSIWPMAQERRGILNRRFRPSKNTESTPTSQVADSGFSAPYFDGNGASSGGHHSSGRDGSGQGHAHCGSGGGAHCGSGGGASCSSGGGASCGGGGCGGGAG
jgi:hypothetical protein